MPEPEAAAFRCGAVGLVGPPNSGKSTLLNALLGQKVSIVTPKPQTTRTRISGILSTDLAQVVFVDTPGVHTSTKALNRRLVDIAWDALRQTDAVLLVLDGARYLKAPGSLEAGIRPFRDQGLTPDCLALNKIDLVGDKRRLLPLLDRLQHLWPRTELFPVSARTGENSGPLLECVIQCLPPGRPLYPEDQLSTAPVRFLAAEIIREKLFLALEQELPYSVAVEIEHWEEVQERGQVLLQATIFVARSNHKRMVIGSRGQRLKEVGSRARLEIAELIGQSVHLELWVKVEPKWNERPQGLDRFLGQPSLDMET